MPEEYLTQSGFIKRELKKKRNIKSLREIFSQARMFITELKPVVMMSPLAIATYLPLKEYYRYFDVILFDEASQVTPEDGIGAIMRGKSLIVVGDSQQLPPTNFFTAAVSKIENEDNLDVEIQTMESLLDECTGLGFREKLLKFHYRSRKEGLIAFSNLKYYGNRLITFPDLSLQPRMKSLVKESLAGNKAKSRDLSVEALEAELENELQESSDSQSMDDQILGVGEDYSKITTLPAVDFRYSPKGRKTKGKNLIEAKIVAQAIKDHFLSNLKYGTNFTLGVVALNQAQQETIRTELEKLVRGDNSLEGLIYGNAEEPLFIKNLENVQGDERDFIFLSIGYAKDEKGTLSLNFGPLNRDGGYRRLNVAITRGRYHVKIFSSFLPSDINLDKVRAKGLADLVGYMQFARGYSLAAAKSGKKVDGAGSLLSHTVIEDVKAELATRGYIVLDKIGSSDYQVDLAIVDKKDSSRFILGLEFDSGSYERAVTARDRDRIRNAVMGNLGWSLMHIWSYHYFINKPKVLKQIEQKIKRNQKKK